MHCNCENLHCLSCHGKGCQNETEGNAPRAMYIGPICRPCANSMPAEYLLPEDK